MNNAKKIFLSAFLLIHWSILLVGQETFLLNAEHLDSTVVHQLLEASQTAAHPDSAYTRAESALGVARTLNYEPGIQLSLRRLAELNQQKNEYALALRYGLEALDYLEEAKNWSTLFFAYTRIGSIYLEEKLYEKALEYYRLADQLPASGATDQQRLELFQSIGGVWTALNQADSALVYYNRMLTYHEQQKDKAAQIKTLQQIVFAHSNSKDHEKALSVNLQIRDLVNQLDDKEQLCIITNNIGYNYNLLKRYPEAIQYFEQTEDLCHDRAYIDMAVLYTNMGIAWNNMGNFNKSIQYLLLAQRKSDPKKNREAIAKLNHLIATIYYNNDDLYNALEYNDDAMAAARKAPYYELLSQTCFTAALIQQDLYDYEKALDYYKEHLTLRDSFLLEERLRQQELLQQQVLLERSEKEIKLLLINQKIQNLTIQQLESEKQRLQLTSDNLALKTQQQEDQLQLLQSAQEIQETQLKNQELENMRTKQELKLAQQAAESAKKDQEIFALEQNEKIQTLALAKEKEEKAREQKENELLKSKNELAESKIARQQAFRRFAYGIGALLGLILLLILGGLLYSRLLNRKLAQQNTEIAHQKEEIEKSHQQIAVEKEKSDNLLLNILPKDTANELKESGVATPRNYEKVTVLFTDFSNFTRISAQMSPNELITELNTCFKAFDEIVERNNLEKIKTIGDSYMCAGGIPQPNDSNPEDAVNAALEIKSFIDKNIAAKKANNQPFWEIRIGIHTGQIIAGVVGKKKFAYDIWGDTVNTSSRMESSGENGKINISQSTFELVKDKFDCTYRGMIEAKNKGKIGMYFVEGRKG